MRLPKDLVARWRSPKGERLAEDVVARLLSGRSLDDLGLDRVDGRVDLRGLPAPVPSRLRRYELDGWFVEELGELLRVDEQELVDLDLSGASLDSLRFFDSRIVNCRFDGARCQDWRMWATSVERSSFDETDLRRASLGAWHEGKGNVFSHVTFRKANLRQATSTAASYLDCDFSEAKLVNIDFQSSSFVRCRFAGLLRQVIFWDRGFQTGRPDANPMEDVDFTDATFEDVEFRRLDLERVKLPVSPEHVVVHHYSCVLETVLANLREDDPRPDVRGLVGYFGVAARWALPGQQIGIFSLNDFPETSERALFVQVLEDAQRACSA